MATISGPILNFSGSTLLFSLHTHLPTFIGSTSPGTCIGYHKLLSRNHNRGVYSFGKFHHGLTSVSRRIPKDPTLHFHHRSSGTRRFSSAGRNYQLNYNDNSHTGPSWLNSVSEAIRITRGLLVFLVEQPSQLKYIEWPSFQSTLKTATLTLILVALLIVALSSVDSALSYALALLLRKKA